MSPKLAALAAWLVAVAFYGVLGGIHIVPQLIYLHDLAKSNRVTQGEIIETYPQIHSTHAVTTKLASKLLSISPRAIPASL
jgi:hypothetical protein